MIWGQHKKPIKCDCDLDMEEPYRVPTFENSLPATFNDVTGGRQVYGNPELERALIDNLDFRWEWYPSTEESLSLGAFYKAFHNPIESIVVVSAQHSVTYQNAERAQNIGLELDGRVSLERISPGLRGLNVGGNASWIRSRVVLGENTGIQSNDVRALEGQSPYVYNLQFAYEQPEGVWGSTLLYNVFWPAHYAGGGSWFSRLRGAPCSSFGLDYVF